MNLNTLARLAGVSVGTVSKAFSGSDEISEKTRQRIFALAKELGCYDKYSKQKFQKKVIAVICPEWNSDFYTAFLSILHREITRQGGIMTVSISNFSEETAAELFSYYTSYCHADGIILIGSAAKVKNPHLIPAVVIGDASTTEHIDEIRVQWSNAIHDAIGYLKAEGHTEIGFIGESLTHAKQNLFVEAMRHHSIPLQKQWIWNGDQRFAQAGVAAIEAWKKDNGSLPTAILAAYDYIAIGVIQALKKYELRVPEDISVIGMDDIPVDPYLETSLSSIRTHTEELCQTAVDIIMRKIQNQHYSAHREIIFHSEFIPRATSGAAKH